jgi:hypothetical protein
VLFIRAGHNAELTKAVRHISEEDFPNLSPHITDRVLEAITYIPITLLVIASVSSSIARDTASHHLHPDHSPRNCVCKLLFSLKHSILSPTSRSRFS